MGKTTLAKSLWSHPAIQALGMEIQHLSRLPLGHDRTWHYVNRMNRNGIFDRFYLSELPYAYARGDLKILFTPEKLRWVHAHAQTMGAFTVLLTGSPVVIQGRWNKDEMYDQRTVIEANAHFCRLSHFADIQHHQTSAHEYVPTSLIEHIVTKYLERRAAVDSFLESRHR